MNPVRKILVPVDFSEGARPAVDWAAALATKLGASIDLFHVWQPPPLVPMPLVVVTSEPDAQPINIEELARTAAGTQMKELLAELRQKGVTEVHSRVGVGSPAHEIVELARVGGYDLIIMGTHGRTGVMHALLGSVAEKVVRRAPCAVLTVRTPT